ncbi:MAG TPA: class IV adenylate cyclase [Candidatus Binatia bacterium]|nr:class IV adenylate cyclase [Candidatus Binatia bacterium]
MSRNIELKARWSDLPVAARIAENMGATLHAVERQHDSYFHVTNGRLKLRRRWIDRRELPSELIWYQRPDRSAARASDYSLVPVDAGEQLLAQLTGAVGVRTEVIKERTVYLHDNVRIHLDDVEGLGSFIEFEAIVDDTCDDSAAHAKLDRLRTAFAIRPADVIGGSYADLDRTARARVRSRGWQEDTP